MKNQTVEKAVAYTPDGAIDPVQTALNKMRADYDAQNTPIAAAAESVIERKLDASPQTDDKLKVYSQTDMDKLQNIIKLSGERWSEQHDRAQSLLTAFVCSLFVIAMLLIVIFLLRIQ
jgi:hypothetical protein